MVYDVAEFAQNHPGGAPLLMSMVGKEPEIVGKFIASKHTHSKAARNIMDTIAVARLVS